MRLRCSFSCSVLACGSHRVRVCVCVCVCGLRLGSGHPRLRSLCCRKAPIGVGHALFVLSDDQLTRIFHSANNALCCAFANCVCVYVCVCSSASGAHPLRGRMRPNPRAASAELRFFLFRAVPLPRIAGFAAADAGPARGEGRHGTGGTDQASEDRGPTAALRSYCADRELTPVHCGSHMRRGHARGPEVSLLTHPPPLPPCPKSTPPPPPASSDGLVSHRPKGWRRTTTTRAALTVTRCSTAGRRTSCK